MFVEYRVLEVGFVFAQQVTMVDKVEIDELNKRINTKEDVVRKLKMVKLHRTKVWKLLSLKLDSRKLTITALQHDTAELDKLIQQWLQTSQKALQDLQEKLKENSADPKDISMESLLKHMNIEPELVGYSVDDEIFTPWEAKVLAPTSHV